MLWERRDKEHAERIEDFISKFVFQHANKSGYRASGPGPAAAAVAELLTFLRWTHADLAYWSGIAQPQLSKWLRGHIARLGPGELARISWAITGGLDGVLLSRSQGQQNKDEEGISYIDPLARPKASEPPIYRRPACSQLDIILNVLLRLAGYSGVAEYRDMVWRSCFQAGHPRQLHIGHFPWPPLLNESNEGVVGEITKSVCGLLGPVVPSYSPVPFYRCEEAIRSHYIDILAPLMMIIPGRLPWLEFSDPIPYLQVGLCGVLAQRYKGDVTIKEENVLVPDRNSVQLVAPPREAVTLAVRNTSLTSEAAEYSDEEDAGAYGGHSAYLLEGLRSKPKSDDGRVRVVLTNSVSAEQACDRNTGLMRVEIEEIRSLEFPLGFALSPEEPRLRRAINRAIEAMKRTKQFKTLLGNEETKRELEGGGIRPYRVE